MPSPKALASATSTPVTAGAFQNALGTVLSGGKITLDLSQAASITGGGEVAPRRVNITLDTNGKVSAGQVLWANDQLSPSGTTYKMLIFDSSGNFAGDFGNISITGAAPIDLALITPTNSSGSTINFTGIVVTAPTAQQVINGFPLVMEGASLSFSAAGSTTADAGISRLASNVIGVGNSTLSDFSGSLVATKIQSSTTSIVFPTTAGDMGAARSATSGALFLGSDAGVALFRSSGASNSVMLNLFGCQGVTFNTAADVGISRTASSALAFGNGAASNTGATCTATIWNGTTGFRVNGAGASNTFLKGNGTNYVSGSPVLNSADFANQGTTTTVLHGNAAGNPSFSSVSLTADVSGVLPIANGGSGLANLLGPNFQVFTSNGTFTIPANVVRVKVTVTGGGGAGGGGTSAPSPGGGGGAGGTAIKWLSGITPGNTIAVTVGAGGTGVAGANNGNNGNNSTIASGTQTITTVTGGLGNGGSYGGGSAFAVGGAGGTATNGDSNFGGGAGSFTYLSGAGGVGGNSVWGGGGAVTGISVAGSNGVAAGAGGGGAGGNGGNLAGGNGANGIVIFEWVS